MPVLRRANRGEPLMKVSVDKMEEQMAEAEPAPEPETSDSSDSETGADEKPEADGETESLEADGSGSQEGDDVSELWLLAGTAVLLVLVARSDTDDGDGIPGV